jgi:hypothetical protein
MGKLQLLIGAVALLVFSQWAHPPHFTNSITAKQSNISVPSFIKYRTVWPSIMLLLALMLQSSSEHGMQTFLSQYMGISEMGRKGLLEGMHQLVEKAKHVAEGEGLPVTVRQLSAQETKNYTRLYRHHVVRALRRLRGRSNLKKVSVTEKAMTRQRANSLLRQDNDVYVAGDDLQEQQLPSRPR